MTASGFAMPALALLGLGLACLGVSAALQVAAALRTGGRRDDTIGLDETFADSRFAMPMTVLVPLTPLGTSGASAIETISSALESAYPEFEVIVIAGDDDREEVDRLAARWHLEPREIFYRRVLAAGPAARIYRSARDPRLLVVQKAPGGFADALNCGVNLAQYRYVVAVDARMRFGANALMRAARPALRDPQRVAAVATHVERVRAAGGRSAMRWTDRFQRLGSIRAFMRTRTGVRTAAQSGANDLVIVWRRDALVQAGGFSSAAADPFADMLQRLQVNATSPAAVDSEAPQPAAAEAGADRVLLQGDIVGSVEPLGFGDARRAAVVEQRVLHTSLRGAGIPDLLRHGDALAPVGVTLVLLAAAVAGIAGAAAWLDLLAVVAMLSFGHAAVTAAALLVRAAVPGAPRGVELLRLLAASPFELVLYRMPVGIGRLAALLPHRR